MARNRPLREYILSEREQWETDVFVSDELGTEEAADMRAAPSKWWEDYEAAFGHKFPLPPVERVGVLDFGYLCSYRKEG